MLRPWNLKLELDRDTNQAIYLQIAEKIIHEIQTGRLPPSTVMPGTRELARTLNVNRKTTVLAYEELIAQGWLATEKRRGTFVARELPVIPSYSNVLRPAGSEEVRQEGAAIEHEHLRQTGWIDFSENTADNRLTPLETFSRAFRRALLIATRSNSQAHDPQGMPALRNAIATMVNLEKNFRVDAERICMFFSNQMAIFVLARVLVGNGDCVVFERLSDPAVREVFRSNGAELEYVDLDRHGMDMEQLAALARKKRIRAVYVTPQHQFPTAVMMTPERRKELYRLAELHDFLILEDDREHEFYFDESLPFPIASTDAAGRVVYLGSLNNVLSPALQVSYLVGDAALIARCKAEKQLIDCQNRYLFEYAVNELMESGELQRHRRRLGREFAERRQHMQRILYEELGKYVDFDIPRGGLAYWLRFHQPVDMETLAENARQEKVRFVSGKEFSATGEEVRAARFSFANLNCKELENGLRRFGKALMASLMTLLIVIYEPLMN
ncbi:MAG TPA: PLP-dependent aminotransferase family protein [Methylophilaceae bacterium]|jgi:GntR family transcriptional regulator/MocR family aminotransferase